MKFPIPAPGFTLTKGRKPRISGEVLCQIRTGHVDPYLTPWPVNDVVWKHDGGPGDVMAVRRV